MSKRKADSERFMSLAADANCPTRVIAIISGKGGVGKTTFAANLAIALNAIGRKTVVIDCNVTTPHLSYYMGASDYSSTINNVFSGEFDVQFAPLYKNGVAYIPASEHFSDLDKVDMERLKDIIKELADSERFEFIILDSAPGLGKEAIGTFQACNEIIYLTTPTKPNMGDIKRCDEVARTLGHSRFHLVLNKVRKKEYEVTKEKAEEMFGMPVIGMIPFDETVMDSTAQGSPLLWYKPTSPTCNHFLDIAANLAGVSLKPRESEPEETIGDTELVPITVKKKEKRMKEMSFGKKLRNMIDEKTSRFGEKLSSVLSERFNF